MIEEIIKIPELLFRGRKIYLESRNIESDKIVTTQFIKWIEHYTGNIVKDPSFYRAKAKRTLGIKPNLFSRIFRRKLS